MSNRIYERFVECPGVVEIRWVSDDPDHHKPSEDMYLCQNNGIPEDYGKKDKKTTEQAHFYCCVCECQSASLKTLRAHCEVIKHQSRMQSLILFTTSLTNKFCLNCCRVLSTKGRPNSFFNCFNTSKEKRGTTLFLTTRSTWDHPMYCICLS